MFSPNCVIALIAPDIAIKSSIVRGKLTGKLRENFFFYLRHYKAPFENVTIISGRFFVDTSSPDLVVDSLSKCFGVHTLYKALKVPVTNFEDMALIVSNIIENNLFESFAIRARSFTKKFSSKKLEIDLGGVVLDKLPELKVNLTKPKTELFVLVYDDFAYFYFKETKGAQGMPVGSQGKVALVLKSNRSDELALSLLKLGCSLVVYGSVSKSVEEFSLTFPIVFVKKAELIIGINKHKFDAVFCDATSFKEAEQLSKELGVKVFAPFAF